MKAKVEQIYTEIYNTESIPGTRDVTGRAAVKVIRYDTGTFDPPIVFVVQAQAYFVQRGDGIEWEGFEEYSSEYARTVNETDPRQRHCEVIKDAQQDFRRLKNRIDGKIAEWKLSLEIADETPRA